MILAALLTLFSLAIAGSVDCVTPGSSACSDEGADGHLALVQGNMKAVKRASAAAAAAAAASPANVTGTEVHIEDHTNGTGLAKGEGYHVTVKIIEVPITMGEDDHGPIRGAITEAVDSVKSSQSAGWAAITDMVDEAVDDLSDKLSKMTDTVIEKSADALTSASASVEAKLSTDVHNRLSPLAASVQQQTRENEEKILRATFDAEAKFAKAAESAAAKARTELAAAKAEALEPNGHGMLERAVEAAANSPDNVDDNVYKAARAVSAREAKRTQEALAELKAALAHDVQEVVLSSQTILGNLAKKTQDFDAKVEAYANAKLPSLPDLELSLEEAQASLKRAKSLFANLKKAANSTRVQLSQVIAVDGKNQQTNESESSALQEQRAVASKRTGHQAVEEYRAAKSLTKELEYLLALAATGLGDTATQVEDTEQVFDDYNLTTSEESGKVATLQESALPSDYVEDTLAQAKRVGHQVDVLEEVQDPFGPDITEFVNSAVEKADKVFGIRAKREKATEQAVREGENAGQKMFGEPEQRSKAAGIFRAPAPAALAAALAALLLSAA